MGVKSFLKNRIVNVPVDHVEKMTSPNGNLSFQITGEGAFHISRNISNLNKAVLLVYDKDSHTYCCKKGILLTNSTIHAKQIEELLSQTTISAPGAKLRICVFFSVTGHAHYLRYAGTDLSGDMDARFLVSKSGKCSYVSQGKYFAVTDLDRLYAPKDAVKVSAEDPETFHLSKMHQDLSRGYTFQLGLYDPANKHVSSRMLDLPSYDPMCFHASQIRDLYRETAGNASDPWNPCLICKGKDLKSCFIELADTHDMPVTGSYQYINQSREKPEEDPVLIQVDGNYRFVVQRIPSGNSIKYHDLREDIEGINPTGDETLDIMDPETLINSPERFFQAARHYEDILGQEKTSGDSGDYWKKSRMIYNLILMITNAMSRKSRFVADTGDYGEDWNQVSRLLQRFEDDVIMQATGSRYIKLFLLDLKYQNQFQKEEYLNNIQIKYGDVEIYRAGSLGVTIDRAELSGEELILEGFYRLPGALEKEQPEIVLYLNNKAVAYTPLQRDGDLYVYRRLLYENRGFQIRVPLVEAEYRIQFGLRMGGFVSVCNTLTYSILSSVGRELSNGYYYKEGHILQANARMIRCTAVKEQEVKAYEEALRNEIRDRYPAQAEAVITLRDFAQKERKKKSKSRWMLIDRADRADDNAEALFKYAVKHLEQTEVCFVVSKDSSSFEELRQYGNVLDFHSTEHLKAFLTSDYVLSSQMAPSTTNPFNEDFRFFRDLYHEIRFVFLQHGVTHNDNGYSFSRYTWNFYGVVTNAKKETEYMLSEDLHNRPESIWETGMPRFDYLYDDDQRIITIMPTWRKSLTNRVFDPEKNTRVWQVSDRFADSAYFKFYNALINDERLIETARRKHYKINFMLHVQFLNMGHLFDQKDPDVVEICTYETKYRDIFAKSSLIVSDYSSILFDFAYLRKPVVYCQFDKQEFYSSHTVKPGYFDFERDGFGEVTYDLPTTVQTLIDYMEQDCRLKEVYRERMDQFFAFSDQDCCKRICDRILAMEGGTSYAV